MKHSAGTSLRLNLGIIAFGLTIGAFDASAQTSGEESADAAPAGVLPLPDYSGDLRERGYLLGDLDGSRTALAEKGIQFQIDWTQTLQSVVDGGIDTGTRYGGTLDYLLLLDLDRMGAIPGALLTIRGESRYGETVNDITGQIIPANTDGSVPLTDEFDENIVLAVTTLSYTQFLSEQFGFIIGKFDNLESDFNEFAAGRGVSQFMNSNFVFSPVTLFEPYSTIGGGLIWIPNEHVTASTFLYNLTDASTTTGFSDIGDGWSWATELYLQYDLGGRPGGVLFGGSYNFDADFTEIGSTRLVLGPNGLTLASRSVSESWNVYSNVWQYLWTAEAVEGPVILEDGQPDHRGVGLFARAGVADRKTNPVEWSVSGGIGGRGLLAARDLDTYGIGLFYTQLQQTRLSGLLRIDDHSQGMEAFYNLALTPAARLTFDLQVLGSALPQVDTAVVLGLRLSTRF